MQGSTRRGWDCLLLTCWGALEASQGKRSFAAGLVHHGRQASGAVSYGAELLLHRLRPLCSCNLTCDTNHDLQKPPGYQECRACCAAATRQDGPFDNRRIAEVSSHVAGSTWG
jgi:hypothetical protein